VDKVSMDRYASLLVGSCLGIGAGSRLRIVGEVCHRPLMHALAAEAYARGARLVRFEHPDPRLVRIRAEGSEDAWLDDLPTHLKHDSEVYLEEGWAQLSLLGEEDPSALEGADLGKIQRMSLARSKAIARYREALMQNRLAWCVAPAPTAAWAKAVFTMAGRDPGPEPEARLWEALLPILRLDAPDPGAAVRAHAEGLEARAVLLDSLHLDSLLFQGPGTDLIVGLSRRSRWVGGLSRLPDGSCFLPNHPTEEIFTSPDARRTSGRATCTRPLRVLGSLVEAAWFEFEDGVAVRWGAKSNLEALSSYLDTDPGARRLGEVALVDATGPIFASGLVFDNGLIDENAASHIALGAAYTEAFEGSEGLDEAGHAGIGFNDSLVHSDFMIGSEKVDVTGLDASGREIPILRAGRFAL
jgi:aminopeptidase